MTGVVVVTGASGAIGRGIVEALAAADHLVVGVDIRSDGVTEALDVTDAVAVAALIARVEERDGPVNGLVNCAAVGPLGTIVETAEDTFDRVMAVNVKGTWLMSRAVLPSMFRAGGGSIVNIGSGAGHGKANMAAYAASKAAVNALTMSLSRDHFDDHVRVNTVIPGGGGIPSGISLSRTGLTAEEYLRLPHRGSVSGSPVTPADVGAVVAFLMSDAARTISGTVIDVGCMAGQGS